MRSVFSGILHPVPMGSLKLQTKIRLLLLRKEGIGKDFARFPWSPQPVVLHEQSWEPGEPLCQSEVSRRQGSALAVACMCVVANNVSSKCDRKMAREATI